MVGQSMEAQGRRPSSANCGLPLLPAMSSRHWRVRMEKTQQAQATKKLELELRDEKQAELDRQVSCPGIIE